MLGDLLARPRRWVRRLLAAALATAGPVPVHVAFIMDGNRRWGEARALRRVEGHVHGYARLINALEWCLDLGVRCVSVYAFSIDNYGRCSEEVGTLMTLAEEKLDAMLQEHDVLVRHGVRVRVTGNISLAPPGVRAAAARVEAATAHHTRATLHICFSYTASEEMLQALDSGSSDSCLAAALAGADVGRHQGSEQASSSSGSGSGSDALAALDAWLYTAGSPPVDLLVRTSGETRLSDFMLWQCRHALLAFSPVLWPDYSFLDLAQAILRYQVAAPALTRLRSTLDAAAPAAQELAAATATQWAQRRQLVQQPLRQPLQSQQQEQQHGDRSSLPVLEAVKARLLGEAEVLRRGGLESPRAVASPDSPPSSPSSQSEGTASEEAGMLAVLSPTVGCDATGGSTTATAGAVLRQRHQSLSIGV